MSPLAALLALALAVSLGAGGIWASTEAEPEGPLYGVKLAVERLQLQTTTAAHERAQVRLNQLEARTAEMERLLAQNRLQVAAHLALGTENQAEAVQAEIGSISGEAERLAARNRLQTALEARERVLARVCEQAPAEAQPALLRVRDRLRELLHKMAGAPDTPPVNRWGTGQAEPPAPQQNQFGKHDEPGAGPGAGARPLTTPTGAPMQAGRTATPVATHSPAATPGNASGGHATAIPGIGPGPGPYISPTGTPHSGWATPGPHGTQTCTPQPQSTPGAGSTPQATSGPHATPAAPGPGPQPTGEPHRPGPAPTPNPAPQPSPGQQGPRP